LTARKFTNPDMSAFAAMQSTINYSGLNSGCFIVKGKSNLKVLTSANGEDFFYTGIAKNLSGKKLEGSEL